MRILRQNVAVIVASWALLALPLICTGGYLTHACECVVETEADCCTDACGCGEGADESCNHETECGQDPCGADVITRHDDASTAMSQALAQSVVLVATVQAETLGLSPDATVSPPRRHAAGKQLPFPESDLPLLI